MTVRNATEITTSARAIERSLNDIVGWATRNDVYQEALRRAGVDLSRSQVWILARITESGPVRLGELATGLGIDKSTLTPQVQRLERDGLVARDPDPSDRRAALLRATRKGRGVMAKLRRTRRAMLGELLHDWSERDIAYASRLLARLGDQLTVAAGRLATATTGRSRRR
jgi:DNA-binding MarR family transcriptional regulator